MSDRSDNSKFEFHRNNNDIIKFALDVFCVIILYNHLPILFKLSNFFLYASNNLTFDRYNSVVAVEF